jgi:hypothetical protein
MKRQADGKRECVDGVTYAVAGGSERCDLGLANVIFV